MRPAHLAALAPVCPLCRSQRGADRPLRLARVETPPLADAILECPDPACRQEYPVVGGLPILVPRVAEYLGASAAMLDARFDRPPALASLLGDAAGPLAPAEAARQHLGAYAEDHFRTGSAEALLRAGLALAGGLPPGPVLELGCAAGGVTLALAAMAPLVLGLDLHLPLLRLARQAIDRGEVAYDRRRIGQVYERIARRLPAVGRGRADVWCADALAAPFADAGFAAVVALNLLDCVADPLALLREMARLLRPGGILVLATPYDWSANVTTPAAWIGGHSQRGPGGGAPEPLLRALLTEGAHPQAIPGLDLLGEAERPWAVRLTERASMHYRCHVLALRRRQGDPAPG